jgi:hypothetical protein
MRFIFDCEDEVCLPKAYELVDDFKPFLDKVKDIEFDEGEERDTKSVFSKVVKNIMVKYPKETGELMSKLWILEEGEKAPNAFKTMSALFTNEVAVDFFTSVLPSLLQISKGISPMLISKN